ncbi:MAG TPA: hypothetical protein PKG94_14230 [Gordonia sp. (in: high G+C Gram-positive bacteria)]|nr:hypothetical protein [Gordonia sp. (in: high G+C Gram-positive bacteria)]
MKSIALAVSGVAAVVVGCFLLWSVGVALVVAGVAAVAGAVLVYDPDGGQ